MYAVMFYVILNKRKLHSRSPKMLCILLVDRKIAPVGRLGRLAPARQLYMMYAVMFYVILNKRKRLGDCVKLH